MNEMLKQFNLPKYIDGLSFADASKKIQSRFKDRTDLESIATEKEMLGRLRDMQEHVKKQQEQSKENDLNKQRDPNAMIAGDIENTPEAIEMQQMQGQIPEQPQLSQGTDENMFANGGYEDPNDNVNYNEYLNSFRSQNYIPTTDDQLFAPTVNTKNDSMYDSISSLVNTGSSLGSNKYWSGGYEDKYSNMFNNQQFQDVPTDQQQDQGNIANNVVNTNANSSQNSNAKGASPGVAGYAGIATTALDLGNQAFGDTGVNKTGAVKVKPKKAGNAALSGAAKGATAGAVLGPWGAAAGAVVGAAAGYFGAKKQNKEAAIANRNATYADASVNDKQFAFGGYSDDSLMNSIIDPGFVDNSNNTKKIVKYQSGVTDSNGVNGYYLYSKDPSEKGFNYETDREFINSSGMKRVQKTPQWQEYMRTQNQHAEGGPIDPKNKSMSSLIFNGIIDQSSIYGIGDSIFNNKSIKDSDTIGLIPGGVTQLLSFAVGQGEKEKEHISQFNRNKNQGKKLSVKDSLTNKRVRDNIPNQFKKGGKIEPVNSLTPIKDLVKVKDNSQIKSDSKLLGYHENDQTFLQKIRLGAEDAINASSKFISENPDKLRYAPAISNAMQLANLSKPDQETTSTLGNRYEKQLIDTNALVNLTREESNANREAILNASGGSGAVARANLLGSQLNSTRAISDAYLRANEINANEARQEQSFNLGVDQVNLNQDNLAKDIRARNKGVYDTEKSRLKAAIATDLGSIGQEELYKRFPELLGMDYNYKGKYKKPKDTGK